MDHKKLDRLFREKLDQLEATPSPAAWSQIEKQIQSKQSFGMVYWIAASVALLLTFWFVWPENQAGQGTPILAEVSHPVPEAAPTFKLPEIKEKETNAYVNKASKTKIDAVKTGLKIKKQTVAKNETESENHLTREPVETLNLIADIETEVPKSMETKEARTAETEVAYQSVKITYIASSTARSEVIGSESAGDSTGVLKKFIAFTEKIDPGEMLADIRNAKDNLLSNGFKSKKDKNAL